MSTDLPLIRPDWPAPACVRALSTTRVGGVSTGPYASLNLGDHVRDDPAAVRENRDRLVRAAGVPQMPRWLRQVHGSTVVVLDKTTQVPEADASWTDSPKRVCAILTADCLPILFCDRTGSVVAAAHAGWRGLVNGVIASCVRALPVAPGELMAWLGPAISRQAFEVGNEVKQAFVSRDPETAACFQTGAQAHKHYADLYALARLQLRALGVGETYGGTECTYTDRERFFSYRRDGECGRMASLIWLA
jgi:YfiH family protein